MKEIRILACLSTGLLFGFPSTSNCQQSARFARAMKEMNSGHHEPALKLFLQIEKSSSANNAERLASANNAAWILARTNNRKIRNPKRAVSVIEPWVKKRGANDWWVLDTLAMAYLGAGRQKEANHYINRAMQRVTAGSGNFATNLHTVVDHMTEINRVPARLGNTGGQTINEILKPFEMESNRMHQQLEKMWADIERTQGKAKADQLRLNHMNRRNKDMLEIMRSLNDISK